MSVINHFNIRVIGCMGHIPYSLDRHTSVDGHILYFPLGTTT